MRTDLGLFMLHTTGTLILLSLLLPFLFPCGSCRELVPKSGAAWTLRSSKFLH